MTSTGSGLAVPDWPTTYGSSMFAFPLSDMVGGIFYEHLHRMLAATVGFFTLILAVWLRFSETRKWVRALGYAALAAVAAQGILGGITVLFFLPSAVSIFHAILAQTFFILTIIIAYSHSPEFLARQDADQRIDKKTAPLIPSLSKDASLFTPALLLTALVYAQLILGAVMRHTHSGLAIPDFPTMGGAWIPVFNETLLAKINSMRFDTLLDPVTMKQVVIHFAHRLGAIAVVAAAGFLTLRARSMTDRKLFQRVVALDVFVIIQVMLGALTIWTGKAPIMASFHVLTGAAILGLSVLAVLRAFDTRSVPIYRPSAMADKSARYRAYIEMTKPRLLLMVLVTAGFGFFLGNASASIATLMYTLIGIALGGAGASVLNQYIERDVDGRMERTRNRPLPRGVIAPLDALTFGMLLVMAGIFILVWKVNLLSGFLVLLTAFLYVMVYTPMKRLTWLNTSIGAIPGALPPLAGWAAATGDLGPGAWLIFLILFLWQHPHFYAIAWLYRDDYRAGDFKMLSVVDPDGQSMFRQILIYSVLLLIASLAPFILGGSNSFLLGRALLLCALFLGLWLITQGIAFSVSKSQAGARMLFHSSLIYLPCLFLLIAANIYIS